ncbi:MAG: hypothetical protein JWN24_4407 [Phycisphaerales bacterium]|nr:hypothetical protein [Phycisphaerales bacterium]
MTARDGAPKAKRQTGLTTLQENRLREKLRLEAPSEPWVDAQFHEVCDSDERGRVTVRRRHDPAVFPPGGAGTAMVRCPACGVLTPPVALEGGLCLDHAEHDSWGESPSAQAIRGLQLRNLRMDEAPLEPESQEALQKEVHQYQQRVRKPTAENICRGEPQTVNAGNPG